MGFDHQLIPAGSTSLKPIPISVIVGSWENRPDSMRPLTMIGGIVLDSGDSVDIETLERLTSEGQIPLASSVAIRNPRGTKLIPVEEIERVEFKAKSKRVGRWVLLSLGVAVDIAVLATVVILIVQPDLGWDWDWE